MGRFILHTVVVLCVSYSIGIICNWINPLDVWWQNLIFNFFFCVPLGWLFGWFYAKWCINPGRRDEWDPAAYYRDKSQALELQFWNCIRRIEFLEERLKRQEDARFTKQVV